MSTLLVPEDNSMHARLQYFFSINDILFNSNKIIDNYPISKNYDKKKKCLSPSFKWDKVLYDRREGGEIF